MAVDALPAAKDRWTSFAGAVVALIGIAALAGWHAGSSVLVQLVPGLPSISYLSAATFALAGSALHAASRSHPIARRIAFVAGLCVVAIGATTVVERALGVGPAFELGPVLDGARRVSMPMESGLGFVFAGFVLASIARARSSAAARAFEGVAATIVAAMAVDGLVGYASGFHTASAAGAAEPMALLSCLGFLVLGGAGIRNAWRARES